MRKTLTPHPSTTPAFVSDPQDDRDQFNQDLAIDTLARTLWGEARGEGTAGMQGVANVVMNRVAIAQAHHGFWWGNDIVGVCLKPYQFSCWNKNDVNYQQIMHLTDDDLYFASAKRLARRAVIGRLDDLTNGATHYHARGILPFWARGQCAVATIGRHLFYRLENAL